MKIKPYIFVLSLLLPLCLATSAQASASKEEKVKAAILYNLARFSEWNSIGPAVEIENFSICVSHDDHMIEALNSLEGKFVSGLEVAVNILEKSNTSAADCHILYLSAKTEENYDLNKLSDSGILTVGERTEFLSAGGGIAIVRANNKLGFSINKTAMLKANIIPSSKILKLARDVL